MRRTVRREALRGRACAALAAAALLASCASDDGKSPARPNGPEGGDPAPDDPSPLAYVIPAETATRLDEWLALPRTLLGDVVEADLSRKPFLGSLSISLPREVDSQGKPFVERIDATDPTTGVLSITLVNRSGYRTTIDTLPTVRIGTGLTLIGTDRVVLRFDGIQPEKRPVWLQAVATGKARLLQTVPERRVASETIRLGVEIVHTGAAYDLRETEATR